ncbi:MAG: hypothetical protein M3299_07840 [Thermoproteota archaeon]|nr:hypothetical protein [Thermoproteota archaeon]
MTNEELEPTKYKVIFEECQHCHIMTAQELLNPSKQMYDGSATYKSDYYLCWSCLREEREACSVSPYHKIALATRIRH